MCFEFLATQASSWIVWPRSTEDQIVCNWVAVILWPPWCWVPQFPETLWSWWLGISGSYGPKHLGNQGLRTTKGWAESCVSTTRSDQSCPTGVDVFHFNKQSVDWIWFSLSFKLQIVFHWSALKPIISRRVRHSVKERAVSEKGSLHVLMWTWTFYRKPAKLYRSWPLGRVPKEPVQEFEVLCRSAKRKLGMDSGTDW